MCVLALIVCVLRPSGRLYALQLTYNISTRSFFTRIVVLIHVSRQADRDDIHPAVKILISIHILSVTIFLADYKTVTSLDLLPNLSTFSRRLYSTSIASLVRYLDDDTVNFLYLESSLLVVVLLF